MSNHPSSLKPWQPGQPIEAARLQALQDRAVLSVHVGPGLTMARVGNDVTIALGERATSGGGAAELPIGQYPGMVWVTVSNNQNAMAYPFSVNTV